MSEHILKTAAVMSVIGALDGAFEGTPPGARATWKTFLAVLGLATNIKTFSSGGKFENAGHLRAYLTALFAAAVYSLYSARRRITSKTA